MRILRPPLVRMFITYVTRGLRFGIVAAAALFAVACTEDAPHPVAPGNAAAAGRQGPPAWQESFDSSEVSVVLRRTFTSRAPGGHGKTTRQTLALPRTLAPSIAKTLVAPRFAIDSAAPANVMTVSLLRVSAPLVTRECRNDAEWRREQPMGGYLAVLRGRGSEPYTDIEISSNGVPLGTVHADWVRLPRSWVLRAQEFTSADRTVQERVTVTHFDEHGSADARRVPTVRCDNVFQEREKGLAPPPRTSMLARQDATAALRASPSPFATGLENAVSCDVSDETLEAGACFEHKLAVVAAGALLVSAAAVVATACPVPEPIVSKLVCLKAISGWTAASAALATAVYKLNTCIAAARKKAAECGCVDQFRAEPGSKGQVAATEAGVPAMPLILSCTEGAGGGGGGTTIPDPEPGTLLVEIAICTLIDHYDADGFYQYTTNAGCRYELAVM